MSTFIAIGVLLKVTPGVSAWFNMLSYLLIAPHIFSADSTKSDVNEALERLAYLAAQELQVTVVENLSVTRQGIVAQTVHEGRWLHSWRTMSALAPASILLQFDSVAHLHLVVLYGQAYLGGLMAMERAGIVGDVGAVETELGVNIIHGLPGEL
ncbi:hypothetical protein K488DRAFT_82476 [Vararia minispora EC-137]|uniref:Uncharacterized protein n=1 Tax=Vararia minispora EC-137 TaxID=1314806 RepID=A0ACB8QXH4_9AGAM|nr:hypothetical protein K488DRAFT_82476 [Vararia minispora EC-137]